MKIKKDISRSFIDYCDLGDECPVKSCCEEKGSLHCGECDTFPCDLLEQFAYDKEQGDDGKRIEQCRRWLREES
ncbi:DUF3795 domain-containing protein [Halonatronum saccharophilum]|uniref:DUF3795 domain-containing protein n=1 Tax=Halonatronum saccharophilum TaxID=150060 RepID=UPI000A035658|nr:DUF3795 domain-containing protein [Halonatronum saccharophilum]